MGLPVECRIKVINYALSEAKPTIHVSLVTHVKLSLWTGAHQDRWKGIAYHMNETSVNSTAVHPLLHFASQIRAETLDELRVDLVIDELDIRLYSRINDLFGNCMPPTIRDAVETIEIQDGRLFDDRVITKKVFPRLELLTIRTHFCDPEIGCAPIVNIDSYESFLRGDRDRTVARALKAVAEDNHFYDAPRTHHEFYSTIEEVDNGFTGQNSNDNDSDKVVVNESNNDKDDSSVSRGFSLHCIQRTYVDFEDTGDTKLCEVSQIAFLTLAES